MRRQTMIALILTLAAFNGYAQQAERPVSPSTPEVKPKAVKVNPPKPLNYVEGQYSDEARMKHINGLCLVSLIVDVKGYPQDIHIVRCTDPSLEKSSLDAAAKYLFDPATTSDGKPVPVHLRVEIAYHRGDGSNPDTQIRYRISPPPGVTSYEPGADGVYPFSKLVVAPAMVRFFDDGYGFLAFSSKGLGACDIVLTITGQKGKHPIHK